MNTGTVKNFNEAKGSGFIITDGTNEQIFVLASALMDMIKEGDKVTFNVAQGKKGLNAVNVKQA